MLEAENNMKKELSKKYIIDIAEQMNVKNENNCNG